MADSAVLRALYIPMTPVHFLVNRDQCETSVFADSVAPRETATPYCREVLEVAGSPVPFLDLNRLLADLFLVSPAPKAQLALILPLERLSDSARQLMRILLYGSDHEEAGRGPAGAAVGAGPGDQRGETSASTERVALRVNSETFMEAVPIPQLRRNGITMRSYLAQRGVIAVHPGTRSFGFLVDLDGVFRAALGGRS